MSEHLFEYPDADLDLPYTDQNIIPIEGVLPPVQDVLEHFEGRPETQKMLDSRGELYTAIIDSRQAAKPLDATKGSRITVRVINDTTVELNGNQIVLEGHKLYALNALLLTRKPTTANGLRALGFDPRASDGDFTRAMTSLSTALRRAIGYDLIGKLNKGKNSLFVLNPNVHISDTRHIENVLGKGATAASARAETITSASDQERDEMIKTILLDYGRRSAVLKKIETFKVRPLRIAPDASELQCYFALADQFDLLDAPGELALFASIEAGLEVYRSLEGDQPFTGEQEEALCNMAAAHRIVHYSNLKLVASIAMKYVSASTMPVMDLIHEGDVGLMKAIDRFDYTRGFKFSTYAVWWIRQNIQRAIGDQARIIRVPIHVHETWLKINRETRALAKELGRSPTEAEIAAALELPVKKVRLYRTMGSLQLPSLDQQIGDGMSSTLGDVLPDNTHKIDTLTDQLSAKTEANSLFANSSLTDREKLVLGLRYGMFDSLPADLSVTEATSGKLIDVRRYIGKIATTDGLSFVEIGRLLGISRTFAGTIHNTALQKARLAIEGQRGSREQ